MPAPSEPRFFESPLEIQFANTKFSAAALVSPYGISRLILPIGLTMTPSRATVTIEDFRAEILLVRQYTEAGVFYGARFTSLSPEQRDFMRTKVEATGRPPHWIRRFPRIAVSRLNPDQDIYPGACLLPWQGKDHRCQVIDFTVDGLRLSLHGELPGFRVGNQMTVSIFTSDGQGIAGLEAEVRNFSVFELEEYRWVTEIGLRFPESRSASRRSFHSLIRDCVMALQARKA
jgi:hypothetical protein